MTELGDRLDSLVDGAARNLKSAARAVRSTFDDDPFEIVSYHGYGNGNQAHVYGRVVEKRTAGASTDADSTLRNLLNTYRRTDSDPLPFAKVTIGHGGKTTEMKADDEGFFGGSIDAAVPLETGDEWHEYDIELVSPAPQGTDAVKGTGETLVPAASARFGVISDIDDTVIQSRVSNFLLAARTVILGNARTRLPFPGVAAFYEALRNGAGGAERNPIFYVSSSPWNIHDVISEFMDLQKIPRGPLLLRDWDMRLGALASTRHFEHKSVAIRNIMQCYPAMEFILIGDTSQHDPEIYRQIVGEFPDRVKAIYIRDVVRSMERSASVKRLAGEVLAAGSTVVLSEDTLGAARHAATEGWISDEALPSISEEKKADEGNDHSKVPAPGGGEPASGEPPTVIGDSAR